MEKAPEYCREAARVIFAAFPSQKKNEEEKDDFAIHLQVLPKDVLLRAAFRTTEMGKMFMPGAAEFVEWARKLDRQQREEHENKDPAPYMGEPAHLASDNPFEQLAVKWELENEHRGFVVDGAKRAKELMALMDGHAIGEWPEQKSFEQRKREVRDWAKAAAGDEQ